VTQQTNVSAMQATPSLTPASLSAHTGQSYDDETHIYDKTPLVTDTTFSSNMQLVTPMVHYVDPNQEIQNKVLYDIMNTSSASSELNNESMVTHPDPLVAPEPFVIRPGSTFVTPDSKNVLQGFALTQSTTRPVQIMADSKRPRTGP